MIRPTARQAAFHLLKAMKVHFHTAPTHHCGFLSLQDPQPINAIGPWDGVLGQQLPSRCLDVIP